MPHVYISNPHILIFCSISEFNDSLYKLAYELDGKDAGRIGYLFKSKQCKIMAWVVWFTGLPGCGKTTIAKCVKAILSEKKIDARALQLDEIRRVITPKPRYTEEERDLVYASLAYMAKLLSESGINVIVDATANKRRYRDLARSLVQVMNPATGLFGTRFQPQQEHQEGNRPIGKADPEHHQAPAQQGRPVSPLRQRP